jgi:hypothetical protein
MMSHKEWQLLYSTLQIILSEDSPDLPKPTSSVLDEFELRRGFRLPIAYREFIQVFGPGIAHHFFCNSR